MDSDNDLWLQGPGLNLELKTRSIEANIELHEEIRLPKNQRRVGTLDPRKCQPDWSERAYFG